MSVRARTIDERVLSDIRRLRDQVKRLMPAAEAAGAMLESPVWQEYERQVVRELLSTITSFDPQAPNPEARALVGIGRLQTLIGLLLMPDSALKTFSVNHGRLTELLTQTGLDPQSLTEG